MVKKLSHMAVLIELVQQIKVESVFQIFDIDG